jgi:A/G-specific adenine glycosylase
MTRDPYAIMVSETMLQQTQVARVVPKYQAFLAEFPTVTDLAAAPRAAVLRLWQGLGYNRRAKFLHEAAQVIVTVYGGQVPSTYEALQTLPGIGSYTAAAIMAFAYNQPVVLIETNVRTVFLHHCVPKEERVPDSLLLPLIAQVLPKDNAREWYWALMDYGAHIKTVHGNQNRRSRTYGKQSRFAGSNRQLRGAILRVLSKTPAGLTATKLERQIAAEGVLTTNLHTQLHNLCTEGLLTKSKQRYELSR